MLQRVCWWLPRATLALGPVLFAVVVAQLLNYHGCKIYSGSQAKFSNIPECVIHNSQKRPHRGASVGAGVPVEPFRACKGESNCQGSSISGNIRRNSFLNPVLSVFCSFHQNSEFEFPHSTPLNTPNVKCRWQLYKPVIISLLSLNDKKVQIIYIKILFPMFMTEFN